MSFIRPRVYDLTNEQLKPMKNRKFEAGADVTLHNGMRFSVTAFHERVNDGFGTLTDEWIGADSGTLGLFGGVR